MSEPYLMQLMSRQTAWLSARGAVVAGNISNANTPGYKAIDVAPFANVMKETGISIARTDSAHLAAADVAAFARTVSDKSDGDATLSGNSVGIETQLMRLGDVGRSYSLNVNLKRAFHQMLVSSAK